MLQLPNEGRRRVVIERVRPQIDCARFAIKRVLGETVEVEADVFADGHDELSCRIAYRHASDTAWQHAAMKPVGNDRWSGKFSVAKLGKYYYTVEGWIDRFATWQHQLAKRVQAGDDVRVELSGGRQIIEAAAARASGNDASRLLEHAAALTTEVVDDAQLGETMSRYPDLAFATRYEKELTVVVDREKARFSTWYELFPRSCSTASGQHGTFRDCEAHLSYIASMHFDVIYLPPIHPIGRTARKGKNNTRTAEPDDAGSPWAIGSHEGGHTSIHPQLGTLEDFRHFVKAANGYGLEIALDIAFQGTPDHPYVREHPEWFRKRADGTIQYAENPPKKYEDIYPLDFESPHWQTLWEELRRVILFWIEQGVRMFRVDNPHTKAFGFWEWAIDTIKHDHPDVLFLAEAFTRPRIMHHLAKLGFSQSYTYFTWRNSKQDITEYFQELTGPDVREYFRPNLWPNTPDILSEYLQVGGRPAFMVRLILAATLGASYGIYGPAFELCEHTPREPGSEEYLNSEKYELKTWDLNAPQSLKALIGRVNRIRRENAALQTNRGLRFHRADNPQVICYSKASDDLSNIIIVVVNLDASHTQSSWIDLDLEALGITASRAFQAHDLLSDGRFLWQSDRNFVELVPESLPAHILRVRKWARTERDFDYYL